MGQYYNAILKGANGLKKYSPMANNNGLKLMEHSYIGNSFVEGVMIKLVKNKLKVAWVGDYADYEKDKHLNPSQEKEMELMIKARQSENTKEEKPFTNNKWANSLHMVLINHSKKQYVVMFKYIINNMVIDESKWNYGSCIHPLPLLTAIGNGKGGGDYHKEDSMIGSWACDEIEVGYHSADGYEDITEKLIFDEN